MRYLIALAALGVLFVTHWQWVFWLFLASLGTAVVLELRSRW
jgi:hypothetical protein